MPIVDSTVREAWLAHVHQVTEDDTLDDIEAWVESVLGPNPDQIPWLIQREDGSFAWWGGMNYGGRIVVGDFLVMPGTGGINSVTADVFNARFIPAT